MRLGLLYKASRLVGIALLLVGAAYSGQNAVKSYLREANPKAAYSADPSDGLAAVNAFAAELKKNPQFVISSREAEAVRPALVSRPLNASLLSFYGLRAASIGESGLASALMASAATVSRRDAFSQLWMIEQKSGANDVKGAVSHYNALLSVHPAMHATFLPVLVSAVAYPEVRAAIRPYLNPETRGGWSWSFLDLASQRVEVEKYLDLVEPIASRLSGDEYTVINARIIYRMLQSGLADDAWKLFSLVAPNVDVGEFRAFAPGGSNLDAKWRPLAWFLGQSDDISVGVFDDGLIDVVVGPLARGVIIARDIPVMSSSKYVLGHKLTYDQNSPRPLLRWKIYCVFKNEPQLVLDRFLPDTVGSKLIELSVVTPPTCNVMRFELSAVGPDGQMSSMLRISGLHLKNVEILN